MLVMAGTLSCVMWRISRGGSLIGDCNEDVAGI